MTEFEITHGVYITLLICLNVLYYRECKKATKYEELYNCALNGLILSTVKLTTEKAKNAGRP